MTTEKVLLSLTDTSLSLSKLEREKVEESQKSGTVYVRTLASMQYIDEKWLLPAEVITSIDPNDKGSGERAIQLNYYCKQQNFTNSYFGISALLRLLQQIDSKNDGASMELRQHNTAVCCNKR